MANSSILVLPRMTAPAFSRFRTASAVYVGTKLYKILEEQVVSNPFVHMLSLIATGTPASGPVSSPASIFACTSFARFKAPSLSTVTKLCTSASRFSIASNAAVTASSTVTSFLLSFCRVPRQSNSSNSSVFLTFPLSCTCTLSHALPYEIVFGTLKPPSFFTGAFASVSALPSPFVTTSSRNTLFTGNTCDIGSTPSVSSSLSLSM